MPGRWKKFLMMGAALVLLLAAVAPLSAQTYVRIATTIGNIDLELYDLDRPITVANFLAYTRAGSYRRNIVHRLDSNFVVQGGGFYLTANNSIDAVSTRPAITNEFAVAPSYSNVYGTIAMAKVDNQPNSATSQWFINLGNNTALDSTNGGFTVFGKVKAGWDVLQKFRQGFGNFATGGPGVYDASGTEVLNNPAFSELPLLANALNTNTLIMSEVFELPAPVLKLNGKSSLRTSIAAVLISGKASSGVDVIEWQLGPRGRVRSFAGATNWSLRVPGLKRGRNVVYLRAKANVGRQSSWQQVVITRK